MKTLSDLLFIAITAFLAVIFHLGFVRIFGKKKGLVFTGLLLLVLGAEALLAFSGAFANFDSTPPRIMVIVAPWFLVSLFLLFHPRTGKWIKALPAAALNGVQVYRIPVEIVLWLLYTEHILPVQMTFEGRNLDIISGILGGLVGFLAWRGVTLSRMNYLMWNLLGIGLLFNILIVAVLSTPSPLRYFMNDPANTIIAGWPYVWLPGFVAPAAFLLHVLAIRKALQEAA